MLSFEKCKEIAKRTRFKTVKDDYCHFILQGFRVESCNTNGNTVSCIVKCTSPRKSNNTPDFKEIVYLTDTYKEIVSNKPLYDKAKNSIDGYVKSHINIREE